MKCPQCKSILKNLIYDVDFGISIDTKHCPKCGFNVTDGKKVNKMLKKLKSRIVT